MNDDDQERQYLYKLFILHAEGKRVEDHPCPNCGNMPHIVQEKENRRIYICVECGCVSSTTQERS